MTDSYVKSWTSKFNDRWYKGLRLNERGLWDQLICYAKLVGDTGYIFARNLHELGTIFGCDARTCRKIVTKMHAACKIEFLEDSDGIRIFIIKYDEYQRHKQAGRGKSPTKMSQKCCKNALLTRPDQTRPEESRTTTANGNVDNSKISKEDKSPLESFTEWCEANKEWIKTHLNQWYFDKGGYEWGKKQWPTMGAYLDAHPKDYMAHVAEPEKWRDFISKWFKRERRGQNAHSRSAGYMTSQQERDHYASHRRGGGSSEPVSIDSIIKKAGG